MNYRSAGTAVIIGVVLAVVAVAALFLLASRGPAGEGAAPGHQCLFFETYVQQVDGVVLQFSQKRVDNFQAAAKVARIRWMLRAMRESSVPMPLLPGAEDLESFDDALATVERALREEGDTRDARATMYEAAAHPTESCTDVS